MNKETKKISFIICFFLTVLSISQIAVFFVDKYMYKKEINFIVSKVETTPAMRCRFYDSKGNKLNAYGYTFYQSSGIKIGDKFIKKSSSNELLIYRKDEMGKYKLLLKTTPH